MYPKIFNKTEVEFQNNGLGFLSDVIKLLVTEERNGGFYLEMEYPIDGLNSKYLKYDYIIMAKPNPIDRPQPFRIYYSKKSQNGRSILVKANHVTFDDANNFLLSFKKDKQQANFILNDLNNAKTQKNKIKYSTNINTSISVDWSKKSPTNAIAGEEGSFIQALNSEIKRDIWSVSVNSSRGRKSDYVARDEKGLTEFDYEEDISEVVTKIYPFKTYKPDNSDKDVTITLSDKFIVSENADKYPFERIAYLDLSQDETIKSENDLRKVALKKFTQDHVDLPKISGTLKLINLSNNPEYSFINEMSSVLLCDYIWCVSKVINEKVQVQVNKVVFNPILEDYDSIDVGIKKQSLSQSISNSINSVKNEVNNIKNEVSNIVIGEDGLKSITSADMPTEEQYQLNDGDIWFQELPDGNINIWTWDGTQKIWKSIFNHDELNQAMEDAELAKQQADDARNEASNAINKATQVEQDFNTEISGVKGDIANIDTSLGGMKIDITNANNNATQALATSQGVQTTVSNMRIGGTNLLLNSTFANGMSSSNVMYTVNQAQLSIFSPGYDDDKCLKVIPASNIESGVMFYALAPLKQDVEYIISLQVKPNVDSNIKIGCYQDNWSTGIGWNRNDVKGNAWNKIFFKVRTKKGNTPTKLWFTIVREKVNSTPSEFLIDQVKIEEGIIPTDWSPAPQDIDAQFTKVTQTAEGLKTEINRQGTQLNTTTQTANTALRDIQNLEQKTDTKFLQTDTLLAMQAQKIGAYYPNGDFSDTSFNKWYEGNGQITSNHELRLLTDGEYKSSAFLSDFIPVEGDKAMYLNFEGMFSSYTVVDNCKVYVHEYDANKTETRNAYDNMFKNGEPEQRWNKVSKTWYFQTNPKYIKIEWVLFDGSGYGELLVRNVSLTNGTNNLVGQISVMNDNINLSVKKGDVINQINVSTEGILIDGKKIHITGSTSIDNAVIKDAMIANLSASKLTAGTIDANKIKVINMDVNSLTGNKAQFIQGAFKSANSTSYIDGYGIRTKKDGGNSTALNTGRLEMRDKGDNLVYSLGGADWLDPNGYDDTALMKILGRRQFTIGFATDEDEYTVTPMVSFKQREDRNWMYIERDNFRIVSRDGYRLRPGSSMNYENNKIYPSLTNDNESVGILLGDSDLIFRDGYRDNAGSNQMSLNRIRSGQLDSLKTPSGGFTWTIKDGTINGNASLVLSGSATSNSNFIGMNNADIWLNASQSVYITDRSGSRYKLEDLRWGRMGQLEDRISDSKSYKLCYVYSSTMGDKNNPCLKLGGSNVTDSSLSDADKNFIAMNNADIWIKAKYNIIFSDGYGGGMTFNAIRDKLTRSTYALETRNGAIELMSETINGQDAKVLTDETGSGIAFVDGKLMFKDSSLPTTYDSESKGWLALSDIINEIKGA